VPTVTFNILYVFFVLALDRRRVLHVNVTSHPHAAWAAQQIVEAVGFDTGVVQLISDRDGIYGSVFNARVCHLAIRQLKTAPRSPWQNGYAERFVSTLRHEILDHVIVLGERHLLRLVRSHVAYYNEDRPHMALGRDAPVPRAVEPPNSGRIVALPPCRWAPPSLREGWLTHAFDFLATTGVLVARPASAATAASRSPIRFCSPPSWPTCLRRGRSADVPGSAVTAAASRCPRRDLLELLVEVDRRRRRALTDVDRTVRVPVADH
jgi:hypothetical protein